MKQEYAIAETNYYEEALQCEMLTQMSNDIQSYHTAIEKALFRYHQEKMDTINKNIESLWAQTYHGKDIATIKIVSEIETAGKRKNFSYRILFFSQE